MKNQEQNNTINDKNMDMIQQELGKLPLFDLPADFHDEMMAKVRMYAASRRAIRRRQIFKRLGGLAAAAAVLAIAVMIFDAVPRQGRIYEGETVAQATFDEHIVAGGIGIDEGEPDAESDAAQPPEFTTIWGVDAVGGELSDNETDYDSMEFALRGNFLASLDEIVFASSIDITIAVDDVQAALYAIQLLPGQLQSWHKHADYAEGSYAEIVMAFQADDLDWAIAALRGLGDVEHFAETAFDMQLQSLMDQDDGEAAAAPAPALKTIVVITLID